MIYEAHGLELNNAIECIRDFCKAKKGRCIDCPAYLTFRVESGDTVQTCKFRCDAPANWEHIDGCEHEEDSLEKQEPTQEAETEAEE